MPNITLGTKAEFGAIGNDVRFIQCAEIGAGKVVVVYSDSGDSNKLYARVGTVSGTTVTFGAQSEVAIPTTIALLLGVTKLADDKFVVSFLSSINADGYVRLGSVSDTTISWAAEGEVNFDGSSDAEYPSIIALAADKFALCFNDEGAGDLGHVVVCTIASEEITVGTKLEFEGKIALSDCCKLDTDKFVAVYRDMGDSSQLKATVFTVIGTTPTAGAIQQIDTGTSDRCQCAQLDTDKFVVVWYNQTTVQGFMAVCTVSGTTITVGTPVELSPSNNACTDLTVCKVDIDKFVVAFKDFGNSSFGTTRYCTIVGTTITAGDKEVFNAAVTGASAPGIGICLADTSKVAIFYRDDGDANNIGEVIVGDTPLTSWSTGDFLGVAIGTIAKINGIALADIAKVKGV